MTKRTGVLIFSGILVFVLLISVLALLLIPKGGTRVVITVGGLEYGNYPLSENTIIAVETDLGRNVVEIKDGSVRVTEADCPNQICVKSYPLSEDMSIPIVCLPHEMVVELQ